MIDFGIERYLEPYVYTSNWLHCCLTYVVHLYLFDLATAISFIGQLSYQDIPKSNPYIVQCHTYDITCTDTAGESSLSWPLPTKTSQIISFWAVGSVRRCRNFSAMWLRMAPIGQNCSQVIGLKTTAYVASTAPITAILTKIDRHIR